MAVVLASVAFWAPVTYRLIGDDGKPEVIEGRARYKRLKTSERKALDRSIRANNLMPDVRAAIRKRLDADDCNFTAKERAEVQADLAAEPITDEQFLQAVLVDWDFKDKTGAAIAYTPAAKAELCEDWDGFEAALVRGYTDAQEAVLKPQETEKNSVAPSGTGS
ncbi:hypothetical protein PY257_16210 [Ramlibacter sp. H39-3-26]|uniref:hypothetical protein n=1 Tax=Curvibacter soli TaxID=3031331 RepID=UPI0023DC2BE4|nr:hypothetical protein [Ramlibacter sp. H39-3-26]MDF1486698.1 hypothetical protein [Ramlibacter sp. H39-3-26]